MKRTYSTLPEKAIEGLLKKAASGVLIARKTQRTVSVRLVLLAACGLAGRTFLNRPEAIVLRCVPEH